jgi:hypothetical protein
MISEKKSGVGRPQADSRKNMNGIHYDLKRMCWGRPDAKIGISCNLLAETQGMARTGTWERF